MSLEFEKTSHKDTTIANEIDPQLKCPYCENKMNMEDVYFGPSMYKIVRCDSCQRQLKVIKQERTVWFGCPQK